MIRGISFDYGAHFLTYLIWANLLKLKTLLDIDMINAGKAKESKTNIADYSQSKSYLKLDMNVSFHFNFLLVLNISGLFYALDCCHRFFCVILSTDPHHVARNFGNKFHLKFQQQFRKWKKKMIFPRKKVLFSKLLIKFRI